LKTYLIGLVTLCLLACKNTMKQPRPVISADTLATVVDQQSSYSRIDSALYTDKDSVVIATEGRDTMVFTKEEFNNIITGYPELYSEWPEPPDITYAIRGINKQLIDTPGKVPIISFESEAGQDTYYMLYAWFLQKEKTGEQKFAARRSNLIKIFTAINSLFGHIQYGGTYFGHQYKRIVGYAEYDIYWYSAREDHFAKGYNIEKQKALYLASLRQLIEDEVGIDQNLFTTKDKKQRAKELLQIVDELQPLITDRFYLKCAQEFQYSHY
jgi:hypothetical protein